ncbi:hypothetical protein [Rhabdochromatium marinum]|uniref:hypothetical protein n=1 Tax=Rhabdochromatium marinum TaxID=48729 RepID=UPI001904E408|nr:hypothetical protein [Rhabdochromatium marinum]MBK1648947.1 hypothetical protein [Rhabdochromatium marinum]
MNDLAGHINIGLTWDGAQWQVATRSSRALTASRVFAGKPLTEVARQIPLLYSVCSTAQSQAFVSAAESILNLTPPTSTQRARHQCLQAELIKEHLWRLLLDWPPLLDLPREDARMAKIMASWHALRTQLKLGAASELFIPGAHLTNPSTTNTNAGVETETGNTLRKLITLSEQATLGMSATDWLTACNSLAQWRHWAESTPTPAAALARQLHEQGLEALGQARTSLLTQPDLSAIEHHLSSANAEAFIAAPSLNGCCLETTPVARVATAPLITDLSHTYGRGLLTRFAALLLELAQTLAGLASELELEARHKVKPGTEPPQPTSIIRTKHTGPHSSLTAVQAARGLLIHRLVLHDHRVESHQVLAPTEWNFHPQGVLNQALSELPPDNTSDRARLKQLAHLLITAIDPCVDYELTSA